MCVNSFHITACYNNNNNIYRGSPTRQGGFQWGPHNNISFENKILKRPSREAPNNSMCSSELSQKVFYDLEASLVNLELP